MNPFFIIPALLITIISGILGWFFIGMAALPGAGMSTSFPMQMVRGLFYAEPVVVIVSLYFLVVQGQSTYFALLWALIPLSPVLLVWLLLYIDCL